MSTLVRHIAKPTADRGFAMKVILIVNQDGQFFNGYFSDNSTPLWSWWFGRIYTSVHIANDDMVFLKGKDSTLKLELLELS
jgi:hypothetical protein